MGVAKSQKHERTTKRAKRGSTDNKRRLDAFKNKAASSSAEWAACSPDKLQGVIDQITQLGGAITLGLSRNRGSYSLTLLLDDTRETMWFNGDVVLDDELDNIAGELEALVE